MNPSQVAKLKEKKNPSGAALPALDLACPTPGLQFSPKTCPPNLSVQIFITFLGTHEEGEPLSSSRERTASLDIQSSPQLAIT